MAAAGLLRFVRQPANTAMDFFINLRNELLILLDICRKKSARQRGTQEESNEA